ncbi:MAG: MlaD family protein [Tepidisphaeraceae bacterium]
MSSQQSYFKLGLFVIAAAALAVISVIMLGAGSMFKKTLSAETVINESVNGLTVGSAIKYRGVTIGKISQILFADREYPSGTSTPEAQPDTGILLKMSLNPELFRPYDQEQTARNIQKLVDAGLRARIAQAALTGGAYLELTYLDPVQYPVPTLDWTPSALYIPSAPSTMHQVVTGIEALVGDLRNARIDQLVENINKLAKDADKAVNDLDTRLLRERAVALLDQLGKSNEKLHDILSDPNIKKTIDDLPDIAARIRGSAARVDELLHDPHTQKLLDDSAAAADNAKIAMVDLRRLLRSLSTLVDTQSQDVSEIIANLSQVMHNASQLTQEAKENPSRILFGKPPPRLQDGGGK